VQVNLRSTAARLQEQRSHQALELARRENQILQLRQLQQELNNAVFTANEALTKEALNAKCIKKKAEYLIAYNKVLRKRIGLLKVEKMQPHTQGMSLKEPLKP